MLGELLGWRRQLAHPEVAYDYAPEVVPLQFNPDRFGRLW
jgi:hypothetical protein